MGIHKLCRVKKLLTGNKGVPFIVTQKIKDLIKFELGNISMITNGHNSGRIGIITHKQKHMGSFTIVMIRDAAGNDFVTRKENVFVIGKGNKPLISLPKGKGIRYNILQEQKKRFDVFDK